MVHVDNANNTKFFISNQGHIGDKMSNYIKRFMVYGVKRKISIVYVGDIMCFRIVATG